MDNIYYVRNVEKMERTELAFRNASSWIVREDIK